MLILSRKNDESIVVGAHEGMVKITIIAIKNGRVRLGIEADSPVRINRFEVWKRINDESDSTIE